MNVSINRNETGLPCDRCGLPGPTAHIGLGEGHPDADGPEPLDLILCNMCLAEAIQQATGDDCPACQLTRKAIRDSYRPRKHISEWLKTHPLP